MCVRARAQRDKHTGATHLISVLDVFPYESSRKRMSVLVRLPSALVDAVGGGAAIRLYTKGADSIMLELLSDEVSTAEVQQLEQLLESWGEVALRTLVWGRRELTDDEHGTWEQRYSAACEDPEQVAKMRAGRPNSISAVQAELESSLTLQGATAIEDKLQDGVPELLADLRTAGVKVWMLTGDKVGTAMNIARACNILPPTARVLELTVETLPALADVTGSEMLAVQDAIAKKSVGDARDEEIALQIALLDAQHPGLGEVRKVLAHAVHQERARADVAELSKVKVRSTNRGSATVAKDGIVQRGAAVGAAAGTGLLKRSATAVRFVLEEGGIAMPTFELPAQVSNANAQGQQQGGDLCLVLDEKAIEYCGTLCEEALALLGNISRSVVACRARKDQKAQMLSLIKRFVPTSCCLAIGDGANDVAMIEQGHIGVGIIGREGREAMAASDYAIGQFRFLRSLLLVHGRYNYRRFSVFLYFSVYKNVVFQSLRSHARTRC